MGFQSSINSMIATTGVALGISRSLSERASQQAKNSVKEAVQSKAKGTKLSTRNTIQEVLKEATMGRLNDQQIDTLAKGMNKKERKQFKENYIGEMNDGNKK